jgi:Flp pilus assembly protein TadG
MPSETSGTASIWSPDMLDLWRKLKSDERGAVLVETAVIAPVLLIMSIGAYDVSRGVARQTELQEVAAEFAAIAMARESVGQAELDQMKQIAVAAAGVEDSAIDVAEYVKCGIAPELYVATYSCPGDEEQSRILTISIDATYVPTWTSFGVGEPINLTVTRSVQIQ